MRRVWAQVRKELTQILRDRLALALTLILPCILLFLMGTSIALKVGGLPIIVQDLDDSAASRDFTDAFRSSLSLHVVPWPSSEQPQAAFLQNRARAALIIPERFGRDVARNAKANVQLLIDASDSNTATLMSGDASQIVRAYNQRHARVEARIAGAIGDQALVQPGLIEQEVRGSRRVCVGCLHVCSASRISRYGQGERKQNNPAGLCFEHLSSRVPVGKDSRIYDRRRVRMRAA